MGSLCTWCGVETAEKFCSEACRQNFDTACQAWGKEQYGCGEVSIFQLRTCLGRRARRVQRHLASKRGKAPETETRTDGAMRVAATMPENTP